MFLLLSLAALGTSIAAMVLAVCSAHIPVLREITGAEPLEED